MKNNITKITIFLFSIVLLAVIKGNLNADLFYSASQYNKLNNEKIAVELELNEMFKKKVNLENELQQLKEQYDNDRFNLVKRIENLNRDIKNLNRVIEKIKKEKAEEKYRLDNRIKELLSTIDLLKKKSGNREKALLDRNKELQLFYEKELDELKRILDKERKKYIKEINDLRNEYEGKISQLREKIENLNRELSHLKRLTESQKRELNRMAQQTSELENQLEDEIKKGQIRLKKFHDRLIINIDDKISFNSGSAKLKKEILPALKKISEILLKYPENNIVIEGHTDNVPIRSKIGFRDNWHLSTERALSVLNYLLKTKKLNPRRFSAAGYGEYHPIVPNNSKRNRALNRRVDIVVLPRLKFKNNK